MRANSGDSISVPPNPLLANSTPQTEEHLSTKKIRRLVILVFLLNVISAALFIGSVNRPVYDDPFNIFDVHNYATQGLSVHSLLAQRNPPGPTSFLWMAAGVRLLHGDELRDARLAALASWVLLAGGIFAGAQFSRFPRLWYGGLLCLLVFPHAIETAALVLTEGPALLFALLGVLAWLEFASEPNISARTLALGLLGGLSMGLAVTCRQYLLAVLAAAALFVVLQYWKPAFRGKTPWAVGAALSLVLAIIPVLLLVLVWKGISSPGMAAGTSYSNLKASVGFNFSRPLIAAFYAAVYLTPLTFPLLLRLKGSQRRMALLFAILGGALIALFAPLFLQPGPLNSLIAFASRVPHGGTALFAAIAFVVLYNAASFCFLLREQWPAISSCAPAAFALLVIVFFVVEQIGVGGNLAFFDRYVLQLAPFLGLLAFSVLPRLTSATHSRTRGSFRSQSRDALALRLRRVSRTKRTLAICILIQPENKSMI
jgi:hypothetical protein